MQITRDWEERYASGTTAWEDEETAPSTKSLIRENLLAGQSVLEVGCGRGIDAVWMAEQGYRVVACDISPTAIRWAEDRAREHGVQVDFHAVDFLHNIASLPRCDAVFERGVLHTFIAAEARAHFAEAVADYLGPGGLWLSMSGSASTSEEADGARTRCEPRVTAEEIVQAVEPLFEIVSMTAVIYGFGGTSTGFPAFACVFRRRQRPAAGRER